MDHGGLRQVAGRGPASAPTRGRFVFSVNVPEPSWARVAWRSFPGLLRSGHLLRSLKRSRACSDTEAGSSAQHAGQPVPLRPAAEVNRRLSDAGSGRSHTGAELL